MDREALKAATAILAEAHRPLVLFPDLLLTILFAPPFAEVAPLIFLFVFQAIFGSQGSWMMRSRSGSEAISSRSIVPPAITSRY